MEYKGIDYLSRKLNNRRRRVNLRYEQYAMKKVDPALDFVIPALLRRQYRSVLGWCSKSVDALADRLVFREFAEDNFNLNELFQMNNPDTLFDSAILSALIASCCFVYISEDKNGYPRLQVIEASEATGEIDPITGFLTEGYAVLKRDGIGNPLIEAYFLPGVTYIYEKGMKPLAYTNAAPAPLLVPIIHRPDAVRPFGRSRISRSAMYWQNYAKRVLERSDVTAEFYSFPQKYVVGTSQDSEKLDSWRATISSMLEFTKDDEGDKPTLGQFTTQSMTPFMEQLRIAAAGFAGEAGLTLDDLGFVSDNPSSAEAIKASHENLRLAGRKAQRSIGSGFLNVGILAACLRDGFTYERKAFYRTKPKWEPLFESDASGISAIGDGIIKLNQALPGFVTPELIRDLTGIEGDQENMNSKLITGLVIDDITI
ncbi:hypothetical protein [Facklamia sp. P12955]|uniref:hypothetical protein n=1 Tax=Facklamia sp. P12955 TaxID=3421946 RepID=UPI003D16DB2F